MNRRSFFGGLLAAACASALKFYPAPRKPECVRPEFMPPKVENLVTGVMIRCRAGWFEQAEFDLIHNGAVVSRATINAGDHRSINLPRPLPLSELSLRARGGGGHVEGYFMTERNDRGGQFWSYDNGSLTGQSSPI